ncbi:peroxidase-related enzyme [bacterium]|nr:peroxidase-related enzyme [bacterium]
MSRLKPVNPDEATGKLKEMLDAVKSQFGVVPNIIKIMANSPAALEAYLSFSGAMANSSLAESLREKIALIVAEANGCDYCLAAHTAKGKKLGLSEEDILQSRQGASEEEKEQTALRFARSVVDKRGWVDDDQVKALRDVGYEEEQITDIVATVVLNMYTNYFNHVADTDVDFPKVPELAAK